MKMKMATIRALRKFCNGSIWMETIISVGMNSGTLTLRVMSLMKKYQTFKKSSMLQMMTETVS
jgi:hypothetical protein